MFFILLCTVAAGIGTDFPAKWSEIPPPTARSLLALPADEFHPESKWPACETQIYDVREQGTCGACWCLAPFLAACARICIAGTGDACPSAMHALTCHRDCGGCRGGSLECALNEWTSYGMLADTDLPYTELNTVATPMCITDDDGEPTSSMSHGHGFDTYRHDVNIIAQAIMSSGPCCAVMAVYEDFVQFWRDNTIDHCTVPYKLPENRTRLLGGHTVRLLGWTSTTHKWIVANTWGSEHGCHGTFLVDMGQNVRGIESVVYCSKSS